MTKFNPNTHIIGKVYDLTQENMNTMIDEIERLKILNKDLEDSIDDIDYQLGEYPTSKEVK